jgi:6-phospho-beta-glucosidase
MKVAVIGGGSTYTPELLNGFLDRTERLPISELWLMDIDPERLAVVGGFAQRMAAARKAPFRVVLSSDRRAAVEGAQYVLTQLRVGGMQARRNDEYLGRRHGLIGQETTGVGGMAKALRTIPVMLGIAADIRELAAPGALLVNFTNPAGLVTEALSRYAPDVPAVGVCNIPQGIARTIIGKLERAFGETIAPERVALNTLGLNHLSWHRGFTVDGEDVWPQVIEATLAELRAEPAPGWEADFIASLKMLPNYYLGYYHDTVGKLEEQARSESRADQVIAIEAELLAQYAEATRSEPPPGLMQRGGAYYSTVATQLLDAHANDRGEVHVVNVPHRGAVPGWPTDWVLELPCQVDAAGIHPLPTEPLPPVAFGLLAHVKSYELLAAEAAVTGDRRAAYQALLTHPLGPRAAKAQAVLDDMLETNRAFLPQFFDKGSVRR